MRRKINDNEPATRRKRADCFGDNRFGVLGIMQDLVKDGSVKFTSAHGQIVKITQLYVNFTSDFGT